MPQASARSSDGKEESFDKITQVKRMEYCEPARAAMARRVSRHARRLRSYLADLGLTMRAQRFRLRGHRLDRSRLASLVARRDYRLLIARQLRRTNDLFLGVLIDCSGSMQGDKLEKAKWFGAMLAEAARGMAGVDLRLFGFTDQVIYDAGDAARPAIHGLAATGGNNDAAALWHVAQAAIVSRRTAKLLVMVSDGAPTECSVAALRSLVTRLTRRRNICCAPGRGRAAYGGLFSASCAVGRGRSRPEHAAFRNGCG